MRKRGSLLGGVYKLATKKKQGEVRRIMTSLLWPGGGYYDIIGDGGIVIEETTGSAGRS